jgi:hypothetical protein
MPAGLKNGEETVIRMVATAMSPLFNALFAFAASRDWTRGAVEVEILALRQPRARSIKQFARTPAPQTLRPTHTDFVIAILLGLTLGSADCSTRLRSSFGTGGCSRI